MTSPWQKNWNPFKIKNNKFSTLKSRVNTKPQKYFPLS